MAMKQVTLGGQNLHGSDRSGQWIVEKLTGWHEPPESKGSDEARPLADGDYDSNRFYVPRMVTIDGILFHKGRGYAVEAMENLSVVTRPESHQLSITDFGLTRSAVVKLMGITYTTVTNEAVRFQIRLKSADPRKFGLRRTFSATQALSVAVFHRGNAPAFPDVTVSGSMPGGYTLTLAGSSVVVTEPLVSGTPHRIDYRKRRLYKGTAPVRGGLSTASYALVEPGQRDTFSITPGTTGTATATMTLYDTYI